MAASAGIGDAWGMPTPPSPRPHAPSLRRWQPQIHDYTDHTIGLYDEAILLVEARHIHVGDHVLLGAAREPRRYRVRYVSYHPAPPAYWRVRLDRLDGTERPALAAREEAAS